MLGTHWMREQTEVIMARKPMTQGQIQALFAEGKLTSAEAAEATLAFGRSKKPRGPVVFIFSLLAGIVAAIFGVHPNNY